MLALKEILLDKETAFAPYLVEANQPLPSLKPLSRINLFVGANNSGKSRFIRELAKIKKLHFFPEVDFVNLKGKRDEFYNGLKAIYQKYRVNRVESQTPTFQDRNANGVFPNLDQIKEYPCAIEEGEFFTPILSILAGMIGSEREQLRIHTNESTRNSVHFEGIALAKHLKPHFVELLADLPETFKFNRVYIPTLRGLRRMPNTSEDFYASRTKQDYFPDTDVPIFTGLSLYDDISKLLLGNHQERQVMRNFEKFLSAAFFHGADLALIPKYGEQNITVKIGSEKDYPIHHLGDGIQSIIALTFPLFRAAGQRLLAFIEEPEMFLHPGLQRVFLDVLLKTPGFEDFQYFIATHSNHFLDLTLDIDQVSIFTFRKEIDTTEKDEKDARFLVENVSNDNDHTLQLLGVRNSSVFFSNCTIWVEGVTDRRYFARYLALYEKHLEEEARKANQKPPQRFKQDLHYSFVEYSGGNITHWSVLDNEPDPMVVERLCAKLFLITDKDDSKSAAKAERQSALAKKLRDRYCCLECREVENLLTPAVLGKVVSEFEGAETPMTEIRQEDYQSEPLGKFIETKVLKGSKQRKGSYAADSGTITDKTTFCQKALGHLEKYDDLSPEAKKITERLYQFIQQQNSR